MLTRIRKAMAEKEEGFTLIELLVVMIIIGILAAIAIPVFLSQRKKAVDSSVKSDLHSIATELESYNVDSQTYPASITASGSTEVIGTVGAATSSTIHITTGNTFVYTVTTNGYCIVGNGPTNKATHAWVYASALGGLQPASQLTCPAGA